LKALIIRNFRFGFPYRVIVHPTASACAGHPALPDAVIEQKTHVRNWIEEEQNREKLWNRERDERFE